MRTYHGRAFRQLDDGSIEIEGVWAGVQPIALLLAALLGVLTLLHNRILLFPALAFSVYFVVLPTRRRVIFDRAGKALRVEHAGPWQERASLLLPLAELRAVYVEAAGYKAGRRVYRLMARTGAREIYLMSLFQGEIEAGLPGKIEALIEAR